ncbi:MAG: DHH family phosphoesterase, partial [Spirochaetales bacterium]|nr:DHH family phosphoesterase [Spirochaetales bacterium]MCF7938230.1 DHH family phosphoesterase [Spirochaetales bacterium]
MKWFKHDFDEFEKHRVRELAEIYQFDQDRTVASIISSIFLRRGRTSGEELMYFQEENLRLLHNPFAMQDMDALVKRIHQAVGEQERVWVFGDRDADGITSTVLMVELLRGLGLDPSWSVPMGDDDYGLTREWIDQVGDQDGTLIITVDCGVTDIEEVNYAREKGIDVIIVDHHTPKPTLPEAVAIVDPKREDTEYPFRELAACGVTAKVGWALDYSMTELYNQPVCLMNIRPANDTYVIEAVKLVNLLTVDSLDLTITPGIFDPAGSPIAGFFQECRVAVYDEPLQRKMLRECFGQDADEIPLIDLKPEIEKVFPKLAGKSLVYLLSRSRMNKYRSA